MEYSATAKYIRISTRKIRLVADSIRAFTPEAAIRQLKMTPKTAAKPLLKLLQSVMANVKAASGTADGLKIKTIEVMGGPVLKRWQAVSRGTAHSIKKRTTHIRIVLTDDKGETKSINKKQQ